MKIALIALSILFSSYSMASSMELSYKDSVELKKTVVMDEILINDLIKLHNDFDFDGERMIAGKFEISEKKAAKKNYLESLRTRLEGCKGVMRF